MDRVLEVKNLNKSYSRFALKDVSFSLPEGCITGFIGINGAGKTTTLRSILGLAEGVTGSIRFFGMDMKRNEKQKRNYISWRKCNKTISEDKIFPGAGSLP